MRLVGGGEDLGLVDAVHPERLEQARLVKVPYPRLCHHGKRGRAHDVLDHRGVGGARDAAVALDVGGDALEGHHGDGARLLRDPGLLPVHHVHDDATLLEDGERALDGGVDRAVRPRERLPRSDGGEVGVRLRLVEVAARDGREEEAEPRVVARDLGVEARGEQVVLPHGDRRLAVGENGEHLDALAALGHRRRTDEVGRLGDARGGGGALQRH
mmetsp:Transcript_4852/g.14875  ORF Transcript_4852/g.14875 Transcript_4852/m.14875 type:complete len:214 (-) Transcript_4852:506-1147(-)